MIERCSCTCGDKCPLQKWGMEERCTITKLCKEAHISADDVRNYLYHKKGMRQRYVILGYPSLDRNQRTTNWWLLALLIAVFRYINMQYAEIRIKDYKTFQEYIL